MKNFIKNKKITIVYSFLLFILIYIISGIHNEPIEEIYPIVGIGYDLDKDLKYSVPLTVYSYRGEDQIIKHNITGASDTIGETRGDRQRRMDKVFKLGCERALVISSDLANEGIRSILNILFANPDMNDRVVMVVSKDKAIDILNYRVEGYPSSAEYIEGMIKNSTTFNFLSDEYTLLNAYIKVETEGHSLIIPYIELDSKGIIYSGMAVFDKDKLACVLNGNDSKVMNMLREDDVSGVLTIQEDSERYVNCIGKVKRRVSCNKQEDKYEFVINMSFVGDISVNNMYKEIGKKESKEIEEKLRESTEKMCNSFIKKMQNELKIDCLQLGSYAAAKYGRDTGVDWNKIMCNSDIKVRVKIKVGKGGIGEY